MTGSARAWAVSVPTIWRSSMLATISLRVATTQVAARDLADREARTGRLELTAEDRLVALVQFQHRLIAHDIAIRYLGIKQDLLFRGEQLRSPRLNSRFRPPDRGGRLATLIQVLPERGPRIPRRQILLSG